MTEPVGPDYGLEPRLSHDLKIPPPNSVDILANPNDYRQGTEFGGVGGIVQPPPHVPTASERRMAIMFIDPSDTGDEVGSVVPPELEGNF